MKYSAITIGPIYKTLLKARSTKAIWSASYLFSYLMKLIYEEVKIEVIQDNILLPYVSKDMLNDNKKLQVGLFPDRILFEGKLNDFPNLKKKVISQLSSIISNDLNEDEEQINTYLQKYLSIKYISVEIPNGQNPVLILNQYLDCQELQLQTHLSRKEYLTPFLEKKESNKYKIKYNTLINNEFNEQPFPAINQIATAKLNCIVDAEQDEYYKELKEKCPDYKPLHKYMAIVTADGDNMGKLIKYLGDNSKNFKSDIQEFSKRLNDFSMEAIEIIKSWGGVPIYAGGDDLLFFAPIADVNNKVIKKDIIAVLQEISNVFKEKISNQYQNVNLENPPSISFGLNISYHKFPLDQALDMAYKQLEKAKDGGRNALAFNVVKHSGQSFGSVYKFEEGKVFTSFLNLLQTTEDKDFISGFMYKTPVLKSVFEGIGIIDNENNRNNRFEYTFDNYFDEDVHKNSTFLNKVCALTQAIYTQNPIKERKEDQEENIENDKNINKLYGSLRYYDFVYSDKEEKETV